MTIHVDRWRYQKRGFRVKCSDSWFVFDTNRPGIPIDGPFDSKADANRRRDQIARTKGSIMAASNQPSGNAPKETTSTSSSESTKTSQTTSSPKPSQPADAGDSSKTGTDTDAKS